ARMTTDANGKICQIVVIRIAGSASDALSSQFSAPAANPRARNARLKIPYWALSIHVKISATATGGAAHGIVTIARENPRPANGALRSSAATRPKPIDRTTHAI